MECIKYKKYINIYSIYIYIYMHGRFRHRGGDFGLPSPSLVFSLRGGIFSHGLATPRSLRVLWHSIELHSNWRTVWNLSGIDAVDGGDSERGPAYWQFNQVRGAKVRRGGRGLLGLSCTGINPSTPKSYPSKPSF